ncbi:unnamed protein product [Rhizophagus irregularis]|nr:unnamed protein product [Rhizophagus irregularis]CAB5392681.1 unnamed protein product [Rhizophagus irregularis]
MVEIEVENFLDHPKYPNSFDYSKLKKKNKTALKNELGYYWTQDFGFGVSICVCCFFFFRDGLGLQILALKNVLGYYWTQDFGFGGQTWIPDFGFETKNKRA